MNPNNEGSTAGIEAALQMIAMAIKGQDKYEAFDDIIIPGTITTSGIFMTITVPSYVVDTITIKARANVGINVGASAFSEYHLQIRKNGVAVIDRGIQSTSGEWLMSLDAGKKFQVKGGDTIDFLVFRNGANMGVVQSGYYDIAQIAG